MKSFDSFLDQSPGRAFAILLLIAIPAFFYNLGLLPLFADEPTRANVAIEMLLTGNFSVPTVGGEYYYNKPPLYNWILAGTYALAGNFSEFTTRLPAAVPMFLFSITIYYSVWVFLRDKKIAALSGILFLINGRMLIYDSMLGHIDIFYSWLTYTSFMLIFLFYQRKKWFWLFFASYTITAITFLAKGLPSIVFQGMTIIVLLIYTKNFRKFFGWQHILCGLMSLAIIGAYFYNYYQHNPDLTGYLATIWDQSSRRTAAEFDLLTTLKYVVMFPFEHAGHLFPASLLLLFCFHKDFIPGIRKSPFLTFVTIIFLANIWVYWLSPQTRPRYLMMLYPLAFIVWSHAYYTYRDRLHKINRVFETLIVVLAVLVTLSIPGALFFDLHQYVKLLYVKVAIVFLFCAILTWLMFRIKHQKILVFAAFLIIVRLGFSFFVLPHRKNHGEEIYYRNAAVEMGKISGGAPFFFYQYHPEEPLIPFHDRLIFYIERTRMQQVKFTENVTKPGYYFTFDRELQHPDAVLVRNYQNLKLYQVK